MKDIPPSIRIALGLLAIIAGAALIEHGAPATGWTCGVIGFFVLIISYRP